MTRMLMFRITVWDGELERGQVVAVGVGLEGEGANDGDLELDTRGRSLRTFHTRGGRRGGALQIPRKQGGLLLECRVLNCHPAVFSVFFVFAVVLRIERVQPCHHGKIGLTADSQPVSQPHHAAMRLCWSKIAQRHPGFAPAPDL